MTNFLGYHVLKIIKRLFFYRVIQKIKKVNRFFGTQCIHKTSVVCIPTESGGARSHPRLRSASTGCFRLPRVQSSTAQQFCFLFLCIRCGLLLPMSHVASSACLSVCVLDTRVHAVQKRLNRTRCRLGADSCGSKEPRISWGSRSDESIRSREGRQLGDGLLPNYFVWTLVCFAILKSFISTLHVNPLSLNTEKLRISSGNDEDYPASLFRFCNFGVETLNQSINQSKLFLKWPKWHSHCRGHWLDEVSKLNQDMIVEIKNVLTVDEKLTVNLQRRRQLAVCSRCLEPQSQKLGCQLLIASLAKTW